MNLSNNTVLITGGTSGIGLALGKKLLDLDNQVILLGRNREKLNTLANLGFNTLQCDLRNQDEIESAVGKIQNQFPQVNILFNNAGVQHNYDFKNAILPLQKIVDEVNINLSGQLIFTQLMIPLLIPSSSAYIINTTSGLGAFPKEDGLVYSATKAAMRNFTTGLRLSLKNTSIKVLEFIPPVTETGMTQMRNEKKTSAESLIEYIIPQLKKERQIITVPRIRAFLWISFLFPNLAHKIITK